MKYMAFSELHKLLIPAQCELLCLFEWIDAVTTFKPIEICFPITFFKVYLAPCLDIRKAGNAGPLFNLFDNNSHMFWSAGIVPRDRGKLF